MVQVSGSVGLYTAITFSHTVLVKGPVLRNPDT